MKIKIDYGKTGIYFVPDPSWNVDLITVKPQKTLINPARDIRFAIENPIGTMNLGEAIKNKKNINYACIVVSDVTRPVPTYQIIEPLIDILNREGINDAKIIILIATGLHRTSKEGEHESIIGSKLIERVKVIDHDSRKKTSLKKVTSGRTSVFINKLFLESDLKILTGYVEPHFFFGFSGGRKSILPGIAGKDSIQANHSAEMIDSEYSRFGFYHENLLHQQSSEIAKLIGVDFTINVCINERHQITKVAAGDLEQVHEKLVSYQLDMIFHPIDRKYDIVICGNGGYPLDLNLYQAVKSMAIAELAVRKGGTIIAVNECIEGVGIGQDKFKDLIFSGLDPQELYKQIMKKQINVPDQWEIQVLARILQKANIYVISTLKKEELGKIGLMHAAKIEEAVKNALEEYGNNARILVLPNGPQAIPIHK